MNNLPIIKISLAALVILLNNYKKIITISIIPILMTLPMLATLSTILQDFIPNQTTISEINVSNIFILYVVLFIYGFSALHINLYRLLIYGNNSIFNFSIIPFTIVIKFIAIYILISIMTLAPIVLQLSILQPFIFILIAHFMLNLVLIALDKKLTIKLNFIQRVNIAILQFIIPMFILLIVSLTNITALIIIAKIILMYWSAVNLTIIFTRIYPQN